MTELRLHPARRAHRALAALLALLALTTGVALGASATAAGASDPLTVFVGNPTYADLGSTYAQPVAVHGGTPPYALAVTAGALPPGLTLGSDGTISGTPTAQGAFDFTVQVTDSSQPAGVATSAGRIEVGRGTSRLETSPFLLGLKPLALHLTDVQATLTVGRPGTPRAGATVRFATGTAALCTSTTDQQGVARCHLTPAQSIQMVLNGSFTASFAGDADYGASVGESRLLAAPSSGL